MSAVVELNGYVPLANFGKDHWSTLAYMETVMVDVGGFQIGADARMRSNRRNFRVMNELCPRPHRVKQTGKLAMVMDREKHGSLLKDGTVATNHDDWCCIQDMAEVGFFRANEKVVNAEAIEPGVILHLSPAGRTAVELLRAHKAGGGTFANFTLIGAF